MTPGTFHHFGVPTRTEHENATFLEGAGVHITDPEAHPYRVEFLRFEASTCMPAELQNQPHTAFMVDDLEAALEGRKVILEPFDATETLRVAFIMDDTALIELMQEKK